MTKVCLVLDATREKSEELYRRLVDQGHLEGGAQCIALAQQYNIAKHPVNFTRDTVLRYCASSVGEDEDQKEYFLVINCEQPLFQYSLALMKALIKSTSLQGCPIPRFIPVSYQSLDSVDTANELTALAPYIHKTIILDLSGTTMSVEANFQPTNPYA